MPDGISPLLVAGLLFWSLASLGTATLGLYGRSGETWGAFWLMSGLWGRSIRLDERLVTKVFPDWA
jgi:hypothetical protein